MKNKVLTLRDASTFIKGNADDSSPAERLARLRELYSGHFLAQEAEETWAVEKRQILRERFVRAIGDFARIYEKHGLWQEAAGVYQVGIEVDSLAEEFHRGLIMCHRELGDHAAAVKAYRRCSELLLKRLGSNTDELGDISAQSNVLGGTRPMLFG